MYNSIIDLKKNNVVFYTQRLYSFGLLGPLSRATTLKINDVLDSVFSKHFSAMKCSALNMLITFSVISNLIIKMLF